MPLARDLLMFATIAGLLAPALFANDTTVTPPAAGGQPSAKIRRGPPPEMQAYHRLVLSIYDADKNGVLDETERAVLRDDIASGEMEPPPLPPRGRGPKGPPPEILATYDADKDGSLSDTERATLETDIAAGKLPPPPPRGPIGDGACAAPADARDS